MTNHVGIEDILTEFRRIGLTSAEDFQRACVPMTPDLEGLPGKFTSAETVMILRGLPHGASPEAVRDAFAAAIRRRRPPDPRVE